MFVILEGLMLHVVCNPVLRCSKQRVKIYNVLGVVNNVLKYTPEYLVHCFSPLHETVGVSTFTLLGGNF